MPNLRLAPTVLLSILSLGATLGACSSTGSSGPGDGSDAGVDTTTDAATTDPDSGGTTTTGKDAASDAMQAPDAPSCGRDTTPCATGGPCKLAVDCVAGDACLSGVCSIPPATCTDGKKDGTETDIDCGGSCKPCPDAKGCALPADCVNGVCTSNVCQAPTCSDKVQNGIETGVDCGGGTCPACANGAGCKNGATDCVSLICTMNVCAVPSCTDGVKNGTETGKDCGGPCATKCATGLGCVSNADCTEGPCDVGKTNLCLAPTATDGIKDGNETGVDCGSGGPGPTNTMAPLCKEGITCVSGADCTTATCTGGVCVLPSCGTAETAGINSCGAGETGDPAAVHESCCRSLKLPTRTTRRMDKYEVTAGRMRTFVSATGPNIRQWVANYAAAKPASQLAKLVGISAQVGNFYPAVDRFDAMSLTAHLSHDIDNYSGIRGCYNGYDPATAGSGDFSANTYWMDDAHYADFGIAPRKTPRAISDEKSMNCAMPIMFAAFCAWDHDAELAVLADYWDMWGSNNPYPWAPANVCPGPGGQGVNGSLPCANYNWCNGPLHNGGWTCENTNIIAPWSGEAGVFYEWPRNTDRSRDNEPLIAAPGRFTLDGSMVKSGGESWMDMYGNMAEYTGDWSASTQDFCDFSAGNHGGPSCTRSGHGADLGDHYVNVPISGIIGVSWEGHQYNRGSASGFPVTFQYGKFGGRCVRPVE